MDHRPGDQGGYALHTKWHLAHHVFWRGGRLDACVVEDGGTKRAKEAKRTLSTQGQSPVFPKPQVSPPDTTRMENTFQYDSEGVKFRAQQPPGRILQISNLETVTSVYPLASVTLSFYPFKFCSICCCDNVARKPNIK